MVFYERGALMSVFDKITNKVSDTAKAAAKKSGELVEVTKLNAAINQENEKISKAYQAIGKLIFVKYTNGEECPQYVISKCEEINEINISIKGLKERVNELKNIKLCKNCYAEIDHDVIFCPSCGMKQAYVVAPSNEATQDSENS